MNRSDYNNYGVLKRLDWRLVVDGRPEWRGRGKGWRWPIAAFLFGSALIPSMHAQPVQQPDSGTQTASYEETLGFEMEFLSSFMIGACGDEGLGREYRKAVLAAVAMCPLTEAAKKQFNDRARGWETLYGNNLHLLRPNPKFSSGTCDGIMKDPAIETLRKRLADYASGVISAVEAAILTCEWGAKGAFPRPEDAR